MTRLASSRLNWGSPYLLEPGLKPPDVAGTGDIEFSRFANDTDATAVGFSWGNQGTATGTIVGGRLIMTTPVSTNALRALLIATPGSGNFTVATRLEAFSRAQFNNAQLVFLWGTPGTPTNTIETAGYYFNSATDIKLNWSRHTTGWVPDLDRNIVSQAMFSPMYVIVEWNGTDLISKYSATGIPGTFRTFYTATLGYGRPAYVGVGSNSGGATTASIPAFSFLRFGWAGSDYNPTIHRG